MAREIVKDVRSGRAKFVVNSGDVVWWGNQGLTVNDSPYWKRVNDTMLKQLPPADGDMRAAGLDGRWFMSVGNHEGVGRSQNRGRAGRCAVFEEIRRHPGRISSTSSTSTACASYTCGRQVRLPVAVALQDADRPKYADQMKQLQQWMDEAKAAGIRKALHNPSTTRRSLALASVPSRLRITRTR